VALPSVEDLKTHLNIPAAVTVDNDELSDYIDSAAEMITAIVGPLQSGAPVTETHVVASGCIILRQRPVVSVGSVTRLGAGVDPADYELDADAGILWANRAGFYGTYSVTYTAGRAAMPAAVRLAILITAAHLWEVQRVPMQGEAGAPVGFGGGIDAAMPTSRGFALPNRALELLRPYAHAATQG
jgi:hypothetical protein